jgi:hypothetical protein
MSDDKVKVKASVRKDDDGDVELVQRELLSTGMRLANTKVRRGDVIEITAERAEELDAIGATAEVGTLERIARERAEAEEAAAEREREQQELDDEEAARRLAHAEDRLSASGADPDEGGESGTTETAGERKAKAEAGEAGSAKSTPSVAASDGPRTSRRSGSRS